jgi:hypothetical protein
MKDSNEYIPGTCNIGPEEIKRREIATLVSLVLTISVLILILVLHPDKLWRLAIFVPMASLVINFQQMYFRFCVNFGLRGIFNLGKPGRFDTVEQAEFRKKDRNKAIRIIVTGIIAGLVSTVIFYLLPV